MRNCVLWLAIVVLLAVTSIIPFLMRDGFSFVEVFAAVSFRQCRVYDWGGLQKETALESSWSFCSDRSSCSDDALL